jgi:hypothetical protein
MTAKSNVKIVNDVIFFISPDGGGKSKNYIVSWNIHTDFMDCIRNPELRSSLDCIHNLKLHSSLDCICNPEFRPFPAFTAAEFRRPTIGSIPKPGQPFGTAE